MDKPVYVIGHRNPDTDSICSAVAYAWLKRQLGVNAVAARAGALNPETQYVLNYFGVEEPVLIEDMYPRLKDVELIAVPMLNGETKLREVSICLPTTACAACLSARRKTLKALLP